LRDAPSSADPRVSMGSGSKRRQAHGGPGRGAVTSPRDPRRNHEPGLAVASSPSRFAEAQDPRRGARPRERTGNSSRGGYSGVQVRGSPTGQPVGETRIQARERRGRRPARCAGGGKPWRGGSPRGDRPAACFTVSCRERTLEGSKALEASWRSRRGHRGIRKGAAVFEATVGGSHRF